MGYTEYDAVYDIVFWQFIVSLLVAVAGVVHSVPFHRPAFQCVDILLAIVGFLCLCWFTTFMLFVCLDMLLLPPLFSLMRLVSNDLLLG
jgi:hypothetical protein